MNYIIILTFYLLIVHQFVSHETYNETRYVVIMTRSWRQATWHSQFTECM